MTIKELLTDAEIEKAWQKAKPAPGRNPALFRIAPDVIQSMIRREQYNIRGEFGWRVEHGKPVSYRETSIEDAMKLVQYEIYSSPGRTSIKANSNGKN